MRVLHVASEVAPWVKTGGLGDVLGALPAALHDAGAERVVVVAPLYREARAALARKGVALEDTGVVVAVDIGGDRVWGRFVVPAGSDPRCTVAFLECDRLYDREGIYDGYSGGFSDNAARFGFLCRGALDGAERLLGGPPDIVHGHDWQGALASVYLKTIFRRTFPRARAVFTIHNLAYQGVFDAGWLGPLGLDPALFHFDGMELHGHLSLLKGGVATADVTTTVSPRYAREVQTPAFGHGLDRFLQKYGVVGILNGIDPAEWSPESDTHLPARFSATALGGKALCRAELLRAAGLEAGTGEPVLAVVSRFTGQKGLDLVADLVPELPHLGARLVVLGTGEPGLESRFRQLEAAFKRHITVRIGFDVPLAHKIIAGADAFLMPSRFEPCGLNQMYAMAYGTVPIVHAVGGLRDTVEDPGDEGLSLGRGTGFRFEHATLDGLRWAVQRAIGLYRWHPDGWGRVLRAGMARDFSWTRSAALTLELYRRLLAV